MCDYVDDNDVDDGNVVDSKEEDGAAADRGDDETDEATHLVDWFEDGGEGEELSSRTSCSNLQR